MTQITEQQRALLANALASASSGNPTLRAAAQQNPDFPKPEVPSAPGGVLLNPHLADPSGISVKVYYPTMDATDVIGLIFNGNNTFVPQKGSAAPDHTVTFQVPKEEVAKALGKTVEVSYVVGRDAGPGLSQTLNLVVNPIPDTELPAPEIVQAAGGTLDVQVLQTDADVFVSAWPLIAVGQRLWLSLKGFKSGGASHNLDLPSWQGYEIVNTEEQGTRVPLSYLQGLTNGSELKLVLEVSFDGGVTRLSFPDQLYTIKSIPEFGAINITNVTDASGAAIANGGSTEYTTINLSGTVDTNTQFQMVNG